MKLQDKEKCINPWMGLLLISGICLIMTVAIFYEFKIANKNKKVKRNNRDQSYSMMKAAYQKTYTDFQRQQTDKIVF